MGKLDHARITNAQRGARDCRDPQHRRQSPLTWAEIGHRVRSPNPCTTPILIEDVLRETAKAVLTRIAGHEVWIPRSVLDGYEPAAGVVVPLARWFVERERLTPSDDDVLVEARPRQREKYIRRVRHVVFGWGSELSVEGDKSTVRFDEDGKARTLATRFLTA
jgi:hypothetical protein